MPVPREMGPSRALTERGGGRAASLAGSNALFPAKPNPHCGVDQTAGQPRNQDSQPCSEFLPRSALPEGLPGTPRGPSLGAAAPGSGLQRGPARAPLQDQKTGQRVVREFCLSLRQKPWQT